MLNDFERDRLETCTRPLSDVIPRASVYTFSNPPPLDLKKGANKLESARANTVLVTKLFLSLLGRLDGDLDDF